MKSHVWNLWGRRFLLDSEPAPRDEGWILAGGRGYRVYVQDGREWRPVDEELAVGVLLSFLERFDGVAARELLEASVPKRVREAMPAVHTAVQVTGGAFGVVLGSLNPLPKDVSQGAWRDGECSRAGRFHLCTISAETAALHHIHQRKSRYQGHL